MAKKPLSTNDIAYATVYLLSKDGRICVANVTDKLAIYSLVATQKFVELDAEKVAQIKIDELK